MTAEKNFNLSEYILDLHNDDSKIVYTYGQQQVSRKALKAMVAAYATGFKSMEMATGDRVVLFLYDTPAFIAAFLATIALGAIPVPVNPLLKDDSIEHVLSDSQARFAMLEEERIAFMAQQLSAAGHLAPERIIIQDAFSESNSDQGTNVLPEAKSLAGFSKEHAGVEFKDFFCQSGEAIAFWLYSSGTTGKPKAVQHTQSCMIENTRLYAKDVLGISAQDKIYSAPKLFFAYGLGNSLFFPLILGAEVLLDYRWPNIERVSTNMNNYKPTVFFAVPALYNMLLKDDTTVPKDIIDNLRISVSAGTSLAENIFNKWQDRYGQAILDGIGATEVGHIFLSNQLGDVKPGCTGKAVPGYQLRILTEDGNEAKPGQKGVLLVKGPSVSAGYWGKAALNAEKFQDGWYRTGDIFVQDEDGYYICKGREDDLFKVNGRFVVPSEVEAIIHREFPEVKEAALVGRSLGDDLNESLLFLWSELDTKEHQSLIKRVTIHLNEKVESYKRPKQCYVLPQLPRNDNGKLVRSKLLEMIN